jgi:hypothetical protein
MKFHLSLISLLFLIAGINHQSFGQLYFPEDMVKITGQVVDDSSGVTLSSVQVLNYRVHGGTMTDNYGKFSVQADPTDTLTFKLLGYRERKIPVKDLINDKEFQRIELKIIRYAFPEVTVQGKNIQMNLGIGGKPNSIPSNLRSEDFSSKPGILTAIFNPLGFMHYHLSKDEKEKRLMLATLYAEREWQLLSLVYNKDVVGKITLLTGEDLDDFMVYCNAYSGLQANASNYEVHKKVKDLFIEYRKTHPVKKQ